MTSTSSSSNDLITDCAPVSCCGATCLGGAGVFGLASVPLRGCDGCGCRVVGALTGSSSSPDGWCRRLILEYWQEKTPASSAAARGLRVGARKLSRRGLVSHQRADQL